MTRSPKVRPLVFLTVGVVVGLCCPTRGFGQASFLPAPSPPESWPRWEEAGADAVIQQETTPSGDGEVFGLSVAGAALGWMGGALLGAAACYSGCGDDEWDTLGVVLLMGTLGGGLGSTLMGCAAAREEGCVPRTLPVALLGTVAAVGAATAVASASGDGVASMVTFVLIQGLITARRIR